MSRPCLIVSTCGTSLWTNEARSAGSPPEWGKVLQLTANARSVEEIEPGHRAPVEACMAAARRKLLSSDRQDACRRSAELNGILRYHDGIGGPPGVHRSILLTSDTYQGMAAAEVLREWLVNHGHQARVHRLDLVQTSKSTEFEWGMSEFSKWCLTELQQEAAGFHLVVNATGGFKALQSYAVALGMLIADEVVNVFESSTELLRIPRLPLQPAFRDLLVEHLPFVRRVQVLGPLTNAEVPAGLIAYCVRYDRKVQFNALGEYAIGQHLRDIYAERLWESPYDGVRFGPRFADSVQQYGENRYREINERIDDLARWMVQGGRRPRLDLKPVRDNAAPGSTHEIDAWADAGARRIFLHQERGGWVLDRLGAALH